MRNKLRIVILLFMVMALKGKAQELSIDADIRPRFEYRHGFHSLVPDGVDEAAVIQQRSRLKFGYTADKFKAHLSVQDVRVWGDTRQILDDDINNNLQIAEAWFSLKMGESWATKIGRQTLSYDDQRILGGLDWAMQGRFHDLLLLKYAKGKSKLDIGLAFSQNAGAANPGNEFGNIYDVTGFFSYKAMEYLHYNVKPSEDVSISLLALNNTFQNLENGVGVDGFYHRQTFGTHSKFKLGGIGLAFNGYLQTGEANSGTDLSAYLVGLEGIGKVGKTKLGLGFEIQSGTDQDATDGKNKSFFPLYGTNHKFNGFMDYFYVGNHANSVGLTDIYGKVIFKTGEKSSLLVKGHYLGTAATMIDTDGSDADAYLGTELDLVYTQKLLPYVTLKLGYSHMFASDSMELLKGVDDPASIQNWGWAMLVVKPNFLKWSPKPKE
ncbi:alginate export family protein [Aquimarina pacifica]|uniref:alginate export family protein n=1 Tax=Aquimarina pacifica TaxID=1296415 RepID=UPI0004703CFE|nr:alginate export family protein [Aquimarina pacifica]